VSHDRRAEKTHDVRRLLDLVAEIDGAFEAWADAADRLTPYATAYRYPGIEEQPEPEELEEALDDASSLYQQVLSQLPADVHPET
jgi:HEPN domain-containing protein